MPGEKMDRKGCDFLIANDVSRKDIGFETDDNEVLVFSAEDKQGYATISKQEKPIIGEKLVELLETAHQKR